MFTTELGRLFLLEPMIKKKQLGTLCECETSVTNGCMCWNNVAKSKNHKVLYYFIILYTFIYIYIQIKEDNLKIGQHIHLQ